MPTWEHGSPAHARASARAAARAFAPDRPMPRAGAADAHLAPPTADAHLATAERGAVLSFRAARLRPPNAPEPPAAGALAPA